MQEMRPAPSFRKVDVSIPSKIRFPPIVLVIGIIGLCWVLITHQQIQGFCEEKFDFDTETFEGGNSNNRESELLGLGPYGSDCLYRSEIGAESWEVTGVHYEWGFNNGTMILWLYLFPAISIIGVIWWVIRDSGKKRFINEYYCPKCDSTFDYFNDREEDIIGVYERTNIINAQTNTSGAAIDSSGSSLGFRSTSNTPISVQNLIGQINASHKCKNCHLEMRWSYETEVRSVWRPNTQEQEFEIIGQRL